MIAESRPWRVEFYVSSKGANPVREFMASLPPKQQAAIIQAIRLLQEFGTSLRLPHARPIVDGIWELRAGAERIFYFAHTDRRLVLLHGYTKKTNQTPRRELETALKRRGDFWERD